MKAVCQALVFSSVAGVYASCQSRTVGPEPEVLRLGEALRVTVPVNVRNTGPDMLRLDLCTAEMARARLEVNQGGSWVIAFEPFCDDVGRPPIRIAPGGVYEGEVVFWLSETWAPSFDYTLLPGSFRVVVLAASDTTEWRTASRIFRMP